MEGMSTQDILNGQDLSTANVDDLLAAMGANEAPVEAAPVEEAPKPKRGRKKQIKGLQRELTSKIQLTFRLKEQMNCRLLKNAR